MAKTEFINVYPEPRPGSYPRWVAIYRTANGNYIHQKLPLSVGTTGRDEAERFALANPVEWVPASPVAA